MAAAVPHLWAVAAALYLAWSSWAAAPPSAVGVRGYRRFHANDSLIGRAVPCTHEEKLCFGYNLLYLQSDGQCTVPEYYTLGDRDKFFKFGQLTGITVKDIDPCPANGGFRMAYDNNCYVREIVSDVICGCEAEPTLHFLGGVECRCTPSAPIRVEQPTEEGHCRIPDLNFPDFRRSRFFENPFEDIQGFKADTYFIHMSDSLPRLACLFEQAQCFSEGRVWVAGAQGCFPLLEKGPCAEEHVVALDAQAAREGRAEATCVHVRGGCPQGHVRMAFDGHCHNEHDVRVVVPGNVYRNQFGMFVATPLTVKFLKFQPMEERAAGLEAPFACVVKVNVTEAFSGGGSAGSIPCNSGAGCSRYQVLTTPPKPMF